MNPMTGEGEFPRLLNAGADALMVQFSDVISLPANQQVIALQQLLQQSALPITDLVPAYSTLLIYYDVTQLSETVLRESVNDLLTELIVDDTDEQGQLHTVEVYYGDEVGADIQRVMQQHGLSKNDVIERHTAAPFRVFALGFAPGFGYMGILPDDLVTPRLQRPREKIPAGSVAIAEQQTSIYPVDSPGGWNIIGRTATPLYQPEQGILSAYNVGDQVQFKAISKAAFLEAGGSLEALND